MLTTFPASSSTSTISCDNCQSKRTPLWRKIDKGKYLCNACGLYQKIHQVSRPLHLCKEQDQIKRRKKRKAVVSSDSVPPPPPPVPLPAAESPVPYSLGDCFTVVLEPGEPYTPVCCRGFLVDAAGKIWIFASQLKLIPNVSLGPPIPHPIPADQLVSRLDFALPASLFLCGAPPRSHQGHHQSQNGSSLPSFSQVLGSVQPSPLTTSSLDQESLHLSTLYHIANPPPLPPN